MEELSSIEGRLFRIKQADQSDGVEELDAVDEFSEEVDVVFIFKGSDEFHDKRGRELR
jgi:hypothetical protein